MRFAGKNWRVLEASRDKILLQPAQPGPAIDFSYNGGTVHTDSFIINRVWQMLHSDQFPQDLFTYSLRRTVDDARKTLQSACTVNQIPYVRTADGIRYFTFAGYIVNKAIGLISRKVGFMADDVSLLVPSPLDWSTLPTNPELYEDIFQSLIETSSEQSLYQAQLPTELQLREYLENWLKDQTVVDALLRLTSSSPVLVNTQCIAAFSGAS